MLAFPSTLILLTIRFSVNSAFASAISVGKDLASILGDRRSFAMLNF